MEDKKKSFKEIFRENKTEFSKELDKLRYSEAFTNFERFVKKKVAESNLKDNRCEMNIAFYQDNDKKSKKYDHGSIPVIMGIELGPTKIDKNDKDEFMILALYSYSEH